MTAFVVVFVAVGIIRHLKFDHIKVVANGGTHGVFARLVTN